MISILEHGLSGRIQAGVTCVVVFGKTHTIQISFLPPESKNGCQ